MLDINEVCRLHQKDLLEVEEVDSETLAESVVYYHYRYTHGDKSHCKDEYKLIVYS